MVYSLLEKVQIVLVYGAENQCTRRTSATFNDKHPDKITSHMYVLKLINKFTQTGSVVNIKHKHSRVLNEVIPVEVLDRFGITPRTYFITPDYYNNWYFFGCRS